VSAVFRSGVSRLALAAILLAVPAVAEIQFTASVDRVRSTRSQPIRLVFTISSRDNLSHVAAPQVGLDDFDAYGPTIGTRVDGTDGAATFVRELTYELFARRLGRLTIGPAHLEHDGKTYRTEALQVEVVGRLRSRHAPAPETPLIAEAPPIAEDLFLRATADAARVYVGQRMTLSYDLCYRYQLRDVLFREMPSFAGFWVRELFVAQRLEPRQETIDGSPYNVASLRRLALFPAAAGRHRVDPIAVSCTVSRTGRSQGSLSDALSRLSAPLSERAQTVLLHSEAIDVEVLPLPLDGRPDIFDGAVGSYVLSAVAHPQDVSVGDPVTLEVTVSGKGNLQAIGPPALGPLAGFQVYEAKVSDDGTSEPEAREGTKSFEYILIPQRAGPLDLPPVQLCFFDPHQSLYRTAASAPIRIRARGETESGEDNPYGLTRQEIREIGQDIRYIKPDLQVLGSAGDLHSHGLFWLLQAVAPLAYAGAFLYRRHQHRLHADVAYARRRRAAGAARQRLDRARDLLDEERDQEFYAEVHQALVALVADHANLPAAGLTKSESGRALVQLGMDADTVKQVEALLGTCEFARFSPGSLTSVGRHQLLGQAWDLTSTLSRELT